MEGAEKQSWISLSRAYEGVLLKGRFAKKRGICREWGYLGFAFHDRIHHTRWVEGIREKKKTVSADKRKLVKDKRRPIAREKDMVSNRVSISPGEFHWSDCERGVGGPSRIEEDAVVDLLLWKRERNPVSCFLNRAPSYEQTTRTVRVATEKMLDDDCALDI